MSDLASLGTENLVPLADGSVRFGLLGRSRVLQYGSLAGYSARPYGPQEQPLERVSK